MFRIGKKVLSLILLVCIVAAPLACTTINNPSPEDKPKSVVIEKQPTAQPKTEVNINQ